MSTQLILYPQYYKGFNSINFTANQFVVDGINFTTMDSSASYSTTGSIDDHLYTTPPAIINTWYRWRSTDAGTPAFPVKSGSNLILNAVAPSSISGVYMQLSNLIVGASYTLTVNMTAAVGLINLKAFNLATNSVIAGQILTSNTTQQSLTFIAQTTTDTVAVLYYNTGATNLTISSISVSPIGQSPTQIYTDLQDGQVICDLYQEEDIPLTLSIDDFKNVAEQVKSYSKDFNLPATKRNNRIFNNMFEVTRADDGLIFNPYVKTRCVLKEDGFILFEGYLRMIDVKDKEGEISYNVNLYSEVVALADTLKEKNFNDLNLKELDHTYNGSNIVDSFNSSGTGVNFTQPNTSGFRDANNTLKYPLVDWNHQFYIDASGNFKFTNINSAFRPFINIKYLIERIFQDSPFNFTSSFLDNNTDFQKLYMDFNWGSNLIPSGANIGGIFGSMSPLSPTVYYAGTSFSYLMLLNIQVSIFSPAPPDYDYTNFILTNTTSNSVYNCNYAFEIKNTDSVNRTVECQWLIAGVSFDNSGTITLTAGQSYIWTGSVISPPLAIGETMQPQFKASAVSVIQQINYDTNWIVSISTFAEMLNSLRGELGQWDFLKGIMTMFNLVSMVDENDPNNILIEPYSDVFITNTNSKELDWTDRIDASEMELKPLTDLNKNTIFQFVEDEDDYVFRQYKNSTSGHLYGSKELDASTATNGLPTILQGTKEIIADPFAATASKPLEYGFSDFIVPSIYAMTDDGTSEGFDNSPRIMYNNGIKTLPGYNYDAPSMNGSTDINNETTFLQFSHLSDVPTIAGSRDFVFESHQLYQPIGNSPTDNLYNTYWQPYFNELYNADTRTMTLKVNLSPSDVASFKFYDTVFIKNRVFRVNKIEYKPNDLATVEFILIP
jgi:hypothetical protein